jgi:hypothetical protein
MIAWLFLLSALASTPDTSTVPSVERYDISATLDMEHGAIEVEALITLLSPSSGFRHLSLQLNKGLEVKSVSSDAGIPRFYFDTTRVGEYRYSAVGAVLDVEFAHEIPAGQKVVLEVDYGGTLEPLANDFNLISSERTELALYCSWFPHHPESRHFLFDIDVEMDPDYTLAANGLVSGGDGSWTIHNDSENSDIILFTARGLKRKTVNVGGLEFRFYYTDVPETVIDSLAAVAQQTLTSYTDCFGNGSSPGISVAFPERDQGGGYGRPGFVVMQYSYFTRNGELSYPDLFRGLAHEAAHIWWKDASVTTWEDWLNESFAEYSALIVLRELYGEQYYAEKISDYRSESQGAPAIWGIDRGHDSAYTVLYVKGPVILSDLEAAIGRDVFMRFLRALRANGVNTTAGLLDVLESMTSENVRAQLERDLRR